MALSKREKTFMVDAIGYLTHALENERDFRIVLDTVNHDVYGMGNDSEGFHPKVSGYGKYSILDNS